MNLAMDEERRRREAVYEAIANQLEAAMYANSLTGQRLAHQSGIGENTIYRILACNNVHLSSLITLAEALRMRIRVDFEPL